MTLSITPFTIGQFSEGVGIFDHQPESFDQVIIISSFGILGFILAGLLRQLIFCYPNKLTF